MEDIFNKDRVSKLAGFLSKPHIRTCLKDKDMDMLYAECPEDLRSTLTDILYEKINFDPIPYFESDIPSKFAYDRSWKDVKLPAASHYLDACFFGCDITNLYVPKTVRAMTGECFDSGSISRVYFDGSVEDWCRINFADRDSNPAWCADLYFHDNLVKDLVIPGSVTHVNDYQFYGCGSVKSVHIDEGITTIGQQCFENCDQIVEIYLPVTLTTIYEYAFGGLSSLQQVVYAGTKQQWNKVRLHDLCFEGVGPDVVVQCKDGDTTLYD